MMRLILISFAVLCLQIPARAATVGPDKFGLGLMVGSMVAMTGKYWLDTKGAVDFGVGFAGRSTALYADYLYHVPGIFGRGTRFGRETSGYLGGGGGVAVWDESYECGHWKCDRRPRESGAGVFMRGLVGFEWYPAKTQFGVFAELGPTILVTPVTSGGLDIGVGGRWYF